MISSENQNNEMMKPQIKNQRQATGGSDSGQGSEADDGIRMAYHFYIPNHLCGTYELSKTYSLVL